MKYYKLVKCATSDVIDRKVGGGLDWEKYGFNKKQLSAYASLGNGNDGVYVNLYPIFNETVFEANRKHLVDDINSNDYEDTADVVEQAEYDIIKAEIDAVKLAEKEALKEV